MSYGEIDCDGRSKSAALLGKIQIRTIIKFKINEEKVYLKKRSKKLGGDMFDI